jgi:hypothetical protein
MIASESTSTRIAREMTSYLTVHDPAMVRCVYTCVSMTAFNHSDYVLAHVLTSDMSARMFVFLYIHAMMCGG